MEAKELSQLASEFDAADQARLALQRELKKLEEEASKLKAKLITELESSNVPAIGCDTATFSLVEKEVPTVQDWPVLYAYIKEEDAFDLLQRRLSNEAVEVRWADGVVVPGVVKFPVTKLSRKGV